MYKEKPKFLTAIFIISVFVGLEAYNYVERYLSYMSMGQHILFYVVPIAYLAISYKIIGVMERDNSEAENSDTNRWYISAIIAVLLSLATNYLLFDWHNLKNKYETEMQKVFDEDWEEESDEMAAENEF